jgi:cytochrome bd ubiquinol oxidase subunit II
MHLYDIPLVFALIGMALYTVLAGADFGSGTWQLTAGSGPGATRIRDHAHESVAPVWEANHVWLIFVLVVTWTAYPVAFGSIASTLCVPLLLAGIGIIFRGATYALRSGTQTEREVRRVDTVFAISSILTPFFLGAVVGGIASGRVPVGNAAGNLFTSWFNGTSIFIGAVAVCNCAYLAAVYLAADGARRNDAFLVSQFRARALIAGGLAGAVALGGLAILHSDAHRLYHNLVAGPGLPALIVSIVAGVGTLVLVWRSRFEPARFTAAAAVAAIIVGWALAQKPVLLPGLTIRQAAAPHDTLVVVIVAVLGGAVILFPSLALLFRLVLVGRFDTETVTAFDASTTPAPAQRPPADTRAVVSASRRGVLARSAAGCLIAGFGFLTVADAGWAHAIGVVSLLAFVVIGFAAVGPAQLATAADAPTAEGADPAKRS